MTDVQLNISLNLLRQKNPKPTEILEANPFDSEKNFDGTFSEYIFFKKVFAENEQYMNEKNKLYEHFASMDWNNRIIFLHGNNGMGKSTFIRSFNKDYENDFRFILIDFQNVLVEIHEETANNEGLIIEGLKYYLEQQDKTDIEPYFYFLLEHKQILRKFAYRFYLKIRNKKPDDINYDIIFDYIRGLSLNDCIVLFFIYLFYIQDTNKLKKKTIVIFDNLDTIGLEFISDKFKKVFPKVLPKITLLATNKTLFPNKAFDFTRNYKFLFCLRDANNSQVLAPSPHDNDRIWANTIDQPVKLVFDNELYADIIRKRLEFIEEICNTRINQNLVYSSKSIDEIFKKLILDDKVFRKIALYLYNYNLRKLIISLYQIAENSNIIDDNFIDIYNKSVFAARGILIFGLVKNLAKDDFIRKFKNIYIPEETPQGYCDPRRIILTVLINLCQNRSENSFYRTEYESEFPLYELINNLHKVFSHKTVLKTLIEYFLLHKNSWVNLITISNKLIIDENSFEEELGILEKIKTLKDVTDIKGRSELNDLRDKLNEIKIRVNTSGFSFLRYIIIHFEYFSNLVDNKAPLFKPIEFINDNEFNFELKLNSVYKIVERYSKLIDKYYREKFVGYIGYDHERYLHSVFSFKYFKDEEYAQVKGMHYTTRVHTAHISYIDRFRLYILNNSDKNISTSNLILANKKIIAIISKYIELMKQMSAPADHFIENFSNNISQINRKDFKDFNTSITEI